MINEKILRYHNPRYWKYKGNKLNYVIIELKDVKIQ